MSAPEILAEQIPDQNAEAINTHTQIDVEAQARADKRAERVDRVVQVVSALAIAGAIAVSVIRS